MALKLSQSLSETSRLIEAANDRLLVERNGFQAGHLPGQTIHELFESQAAHTPGSIAIDFLPSETAAGRQLTYRELNQQANQLAHHLRELGVGPETPVAICLERSPELIVAILGVLKAGAAYLPLDPTYPAERLAYMLADSQAAVLLTQRQFLSRLPQHQARTLCLDVDRAAIARQPIENPRSSVTADNLAYVIYTSGSTGRPKGVLVPHRGVNNVAQAQLRAFDLRPDDRILQFASLSFDASVFEIVMALRAGATLCVGSRESLLPGPNLARFLRQARITVATLTPSSLAATPVAELPELRVINVAGEACPAHLVASWAEGRQFFNLYGPTEATIWATVARCADGSRKPPIGRPIANTQVHLIGEDAEPLLPELGSQPGELYIGGLGVARGYLNRPGLTAERFVPDPFSDQPGARLYKTGDLARYLPDGSLDFLGRVDHQVKIRGFRIELGEVEAALNRHPAVQQAVILVRNDLPGVGQRLVAYLVLDRQQPANPNQLRRFLRQTLPNYMIPATFVFLDALPLTPNGKVDRAALPMPTRSRPDREVAFIPPRTAVEKQLAGIWAGVLGLERVGVGDDFFDLGGHSLALSQVIARTRDAFQVDPPLQTLFDHSTVADLARQIERLRQAAEAESLPPIRPVEHSGPQPLSFSQERVWFMRELLPHNIAYNAQSTIRFRGRLIIPILERALGEIVRRHEMLRTIFVTVNGEPRQVIQPPWPVTLPVIDLSHLPAQQREEEAHKRIRQAFQHTFDTGQLPLIRWTLLRLDAEDHILVQVEQHFIHDGWSFAVEMAEFKALYTAFAAGKPSPLPELPVQFIDFVLWQRQWLQGEALSAQLDYWREQLAGMTTELNLPTDHPRPRIQSLQGGAVRIELPAELSAALRALSRREGVTLFMTLLTALKGLLARYTGQDDIAVGSSLANRRLHEIEKLIGMVVNNVVLRTDFSGQPTFREALRRVRDAALGAYAHQDIPFERIVEALQPNRDLSRNPLFQVIFSFHDAPVPPLTLPGVTGHVEYHQNDSAKFDLNVLVIPRAEQRFGRSVAAEEERLTVIWEYSSDIFEAATVQRMADHFHALLERIVVDPDQQLDAIDFLDPAERRQLLVEWNDTQVRYSRFECLHKSFEAQAMRRPNALAVAFGDQHLTYGELNRRSNQLARYLQKLGVKPNVLVAICMESSIEMITAMLGVLKAGGAYAPLDPAYPQERLAFMLADTQTPVLLTQERLLQSLPQHSAQVIRLDADWETIAQEEDETLPSQWTTRNLAYVIYTSGSTGRPKGVQIEHRSLVNLLLWHQRTFAVSEQDRATKLAGLAFDASVWELWPYLAAGASIHIPDEETRAAPERLRDWLIAQQITITFLPTPLAESVLALDWPQDVALRTLLTGGDKLHYYASPGLPFALVNNYGPTENTVVATSGLTPVRAEAETAPAIGRPIANSQVYLLDARQQPVPVGVPGELCIGGMGLARGYLGRPALTAERFIPDPFGGKPGARLYRTGDLARYRPDGNIEFLGRIDHQVKVRGFRIELGEIEAVLEQHPQVQRAIVMARQDSLGGVTPLEADKRLVAYVILLDGREPSADELRRFLKRSLPDYMIPTAFVFSEAFPLTPNGKVDRRALPALDWNNRDAAEIFAPPGSLTEEIVAEVWSEVLGLERLSIHDNFFALGGHSLKATQVLSRLREALQVDLSLRDFFGVPTVAELAAVIEELLIQDMAALSEEEIERLVVQGA